MNKILNSSPHFVADSTSCHTKHLYNFLEYVQGGPKMTSVISLARCIATFLLAQVLFYANKPKL